MEKIELEEIKKEAKEIMDNFLKELQNIEIEKDYKNFRKKSLRSENEDTDEQDERKEFRERFFKNAPKSSEDYVITKKGDWIK